MAVERRYILRVEFSQEFPDASDEYGYDQHKLAHKDYLATDQDSLFEKIAKLRQLWLQHHLVEIYELDHDRTWGRVKAMDTISSRTGSAGIGFYTGFYHGRMRPGENDPLLVISFRNKIDTPVGYNSAYDLVVIHAVSDHEALFGSPEEKADEQTMRNIRQCNSDILIFNAQWLAFPSPSKPSDVEDDDPSDE